MKRVICILFAVVIYAVVLPRALAYDEERFGQQMDAIGGGALTGGDADGEFNACTAWISGRDFGHAGDQFMGVVFGAAAPCVAGCSGFSAGDAAQLDQVVCDSGIMRLCEWICAGEPADYHDGRRVSGGGCIVWRFPVGAPCGVGCD